MIDGTHAELFNIKYHLVLATCFAPVRKVIQGPMCSQMGEDLHPGMNNHYDYSH